MEGGDEWRSESLKTQGLHLRVKRKTDRYDLHKYGNGGPETAELIWGHIGEKKQSYIWFITCVHNWTWLNSFQLKKKRRQTERRQGQKRDK